MWSVKEPWMWKHLEVCKIFLREFFICFLLWADTLPGVYTQCISHFTVILLTPTGAPADQDEGEYMMCAVSRLSFFWLFVLYCCSLGDCKHCSILLGRSVILQDQLCSLQAKVNCKSIFYTINCLATVPLTGIEFQVSYIEYTVFLLQSFLVFSETYQGLVQAVGNPRVARSSAF